MFDRSVFLDRILKYIMNLKIGYLFPKMHMDELEINCRPSDKVKLLNSALCKEFIERRDHQKYLAVVEAALHEIEYMTKATIRLTETVARDLEEANARMILKKCKENGIISNLKPKDTDFDAEKASVKSELDSNKVNPFGMYRSEDLIKAKTLKTFVLHDRVVGKIVSNLKYFIFLEDNGNFFVKVVYLENSWLNLLVRCSPWFFINEVGIDEFEISKEKFMEMKRTANYKSEISLGYSTFYVGKLVEILEETLCKYYNNKLTLLTEEENAPKNAK